MVTNAFHAAKLDIQLNNLRENPVNETPVLPAPSIPTSKALIQAIRDVDLQCIISAVKTIPNYKISPAEEGEIVNAVIKNILSLDWNKK
jgi:hypothetical protein